MEISSGGNIVLSLSCAMWLYRWKLCSRCHCELGSVSELAISAIQKMMGKGRPAFYESSGSQFYDGCFVSLVRLSDLFQILDEAKISMT